MIKVNVSQKNELEFENSHSTTGTHFDMRVAEPNGHRSLHSKARFLSGEVLSNFEPAEKVEIPNYLSVQVSLTDHILLAPVYLELINHSCEPNVFFDVTSWELKAVRDIFEGDELTFFYPSTEWSMTQPFQCLCQSKSCLKFVQGASHISDEIILSYKLNSHIEELLKQRKNRLVSTNTTS